MMQGGGFSQTLELRIPKKAIKNEANNGLTNTKGTLAMARTGYPHSATSQFFINFADNTHLNHRNETNAGYGYTVFAKIISNPETEAFLETIEKAEEQRMGQHQHVPVIPIIIRNVTIQKGKITL